MITPHYCPHCGLRLREIRTAAGGVESEISCKNGHVWSVRIERRDGIAGPVEYWIFTGSSER